MNFETIAVNVEKKVAVAVEDVVHVGSDVFKILADVKTLTPAFRAELGTLIADASPIAIALSPIIASNGSNVAADLAAVAPVLADLKKLVADFVAFLPTLKLAATDLAADTK